jgi:spore germination protein KC
MMESTIADSITEAYHNMGLRLNRELFFEHMRILVLGEDVARQGIRQVINVFARQVQFNRRSRFVIAEGTAKKILEIEPWVEKIKAEYLQSIYANETVTGKFVDGDFGDFLHQINAFNGDALVSKITPGKQEVSIGGAAVINDYKLVGWLSEEETQGVNFFLGKMRGGALVVGDPHSGDEASFVVRRAHRKLYMVSDKPIPRFTVQINIEGDVTEITHKREIEVEEIKGIQKAVADIVKRQIEKGLSKLQKDYKTDLLRLNDYMYKYHPKVWQNYEDVWDDIFPDVEITVDVKVQIRDIGVTK